MIKQTATFRIDRTCRLLKLNIETGNQNWVDLNSYTEAIAFHTESSQIVAITTDLEEEAHIRKLVLINETSGEVYQSLLNLHSDYFIQ